jgi:diguanylate cyclase (GGDEF)-like protein
VNGLNQITRELSVRASIWAAAVVATLIAVATVLLLPISNHPMLEVKPFLPMFATTVFITECLTGYLLFTHFRSTREPFLAALSGASWFVAVMVAVQLLIFPGVFSATGLFAAGSQSAVWLWVLWHGGYATLVLLALLLRLPKATRSHEAIGSRFGVAMLLIGPIIAALLAYFVVADGRPLPTLIEGTSYARLAYSPSAAAVLALNVLALVACVWITRLRDVLSVWLAVALLASLADVILTLSASSRYSVGWYAARCLSVLSSSTLLGVLVWQTSSLYRQLAIAHRALAERSVHDALTGVYNRGYFNEQFPRDIRRAQRERAPLALLIADIDHFKSYNDTFGHPQGDACLRAIASAMRTPLHRPGDYLARYGGEEFVIVLPLTDAAGALHIADSLLGAVARLNLPSARGADKPVTISIGVSTFNPATDTHGIDEIIHRADTALYQAKNGGRNAVVAFDAQRV